MIKNPGNRVRAVALSSLLAMSCACPKAEPKMGAVSQPVAEEKVTTEKKNDSSNAKEAEQKKAEPKKENQVCFGLREVKYTKKQIIKPKIGPEEVNFGEDYENICLNTVGFVFFAEIGSNAMRVYPDSPEVKITKIDEKGVEIEFNGEKESLLYGNRIGELLLTLRFEKVDGEKVVKVISGDPQDFCGYTEMKRTTKGKMKAAAASIRASSVEDVTEAKPGEDESKKRPERIPEF